MSGPQSFAVDVDGPACADALAAQRDRAYRCQGRQVLTPDRLAKLKPPPCDSLSRTTPFALFQRALACPEALDGPRLQLKCGASPSPCTLSRWERGRKRFLAAARNYIATAGPFDRLRARRQFITLTARTTEDPSASLGMRALTGDPCLTVRNSGT